MVFFIKKGINYIYYFLKYCKIWKFYYRNNEFEYDEKVISWFNGYIWLYFLDEKFCIKYK